MHAKYSLLMVVLLVYWSLSMLMLRAMPRSSNYKYVRCLSCSPDGTMSITRMLMHSSGASMQAVNSSEIAVAVG